MWTPKAGPSKARPCDLRTHRGVDREHRCPFEVLTRESGKAQRPQSWLWEGGRGSPELPRLGFSPGDPLWTAD